VRKFSTIALLIAFVLPFAAKPVAAQAPIPETETDQTLHAMHDEMERARTRLQLPGVDKPFYIPVQTPATAS
jgi:hypothetical protein